MDYHYLGRPPIFVESMIKDDIARPLATPALGDLAKDLVKVEKGGFFVLGAVAGALATWFFMKRR